MTLLLVALEPEDLPPPSDGPFWNVMLLPANLHCPHECVGGPLDGALLPCGPSNLALCHLIAPPYDGRFGAARRMDGAPRGLYRLVQRGRAREWHWQPDGAERLTPRSYAQLVGYSGA